MCIFGQDSCDCRLSMTSEGVIFLLLLNVAEVVNDASSWYVSFDRVVCEPTLDLYFLQDPPTATLVSFLSDVSFSTGRLFGFIEEFSV